MISINNVSKIFGKVVALDNISLEINEGEIFGFIGKNGAGKSTTIRVLLNLLFATSGACTIDGLDCEKDNKQIKELVSYVPSETIFYDNIKVSDVLRYATQLNNLEKDVVNNLTKFFELDVSKKINELSLGNKKKVSLVLCFAKNSKVLIFDEPTSGLDPLMKDKFFELLRQAKKEGKTVFLSSHNLDEVQKMCDRLAIIKAGQIVKILTKKDLKKTSVQIIEYVDDAGIEHEEKFDGDINEKIKELTKIKLQSLQIRNESLDETIKQYYEGDVL
ncbi:MAG: ATP-binding cassette domain-containing protein [Bacilli bacterium]